MQQKHRNVESIYPLSPMQEGMLFHSLYDPSSGAYVEQLTCQLHGGLQPGAFQQAWQQVIARHGILRTSFHWSKQAASLQVAHLQITLPWHEQDWRAFSPVEQQEQLGALLQADRARGFDLSQAPLLRLTLLRLSNEAYQFIWSYHHALLDGWSMPLLLREVFTFYQANSRGETLTLPRPRPYRDYITWLQQQDMAVAARFWQQYLQGFTTPTPLVVDSAPSGQPQVLGQYALKSLELAETSTTSLQVIARRYALTINTLLQGAWALLLSRYSGEFDVVFGTTVAGRPPELTGVESMIGMFLNTLPVRVRVSPGQPVHAFLQDLQSQQVEARQYEYSPLAQVQGWGELPHGLPLFESLIIFENYPVTAASVTGSVAQNGLSGRKGLQGIQLREVHSVEQTNYPLTLIADAKHTLVLQISYACDRFEAETIERLLGHLQTVLEAFASHPEQRVDQVPLLTAAEREQLLLAWNGNATPSPCSENKPVPQYAFVHRLFEHQAARTPEAIAVVFEDRHMTYQELNQRANQLALILQNQGVHPEVRVGLCMERSPELVIGILGILKAGGVYLPLDPTYPRERLSFLLNDACLSFLLLQKALQSHLPHHSAFTLCLDMQWSIVASQPVDNLSCELHPLNIAYVIYTSGSTGQPKGVQIPHQGLLNLTVSFLSTHDLASSSRVLQLISPTFDPSIADIFIALCAGATLCLAPVELLTAGGSALHHFMFEQAITLARSTPLMLIPLPDGPLPSLRTIATGGEAWPLELLTRHWARGRRFLNEYGPTEASICATLETYTEHETRPAIIGHPIVNVEVYILARHGHLLPVGVPGELYIGGIGLSRSYLGRSDLTAERFVPHPFGSQPGSRLYRTGDLARYRSDGSLEFLGRVDTQVKIRGYRIEPGEIESVLAQHPAVQTCMVLARDDTPGDRRLVAYVVPNTLQQDSSPKGAGEWRRFLLERLPAYMAPAAFVTLEALPLTTNGKVDRRALPAPESSRPRLETAYTAPRTPEEELLTSIWAQVLGLEKVGIHDNFFELGGDSILSIQVIARATRAGLRLTPRQLFQRQTIAALATLANTAPEALAEQGPVTGQAPLTPIQRWFFEQQLPEPHYFNQSLLLIVRRPLTLRVLQRVVAQLLAHHDALRMRFRLTNQGWQQHNAGPESPHSQPSPQHASTWTSRASHPLSK